jgi:hypothetical protein
MKIKSLRRACHRTAVRCSSEESAFSYWNILGPDRGDSVPILNTRFLSVDVLTLDMAFEEVNLSLFESTVGDLRLNIPDEGRKRL